MKLKQLVTGVLVTLMGCAHADRVVEMHEVSADGVGKQIGTVTVSESEAGLVFNPDLRGLQMGLHGFHVHQNPSCKPGMKKGEKAAAISAGGHYDPKGAGHHDEPWGDGHLGDLPALFVDAHGRAVHPVLAPRLKPDDLEGRALMIHAGSDNYSDDPEPLGGGGPRVACGVIESQ